MKKFFAIPGVLALVVSGVYSFPVTTPTAHADGNQISTVSIPLTTQGGELTETATQGFDIDATTDAEHTVSEAPAKNTVFLASVRKTNDSNDIEDTAREKFTILSAPIAVDDPFAVSGVTWKSGQTLPEDAVIEMRTLDGTEWSQWYSLEIVNESDNKGERNGTEYMVSGNSQGIQVRITHTTGNLPDDLRIDISYSPDGVSQVETENDIADVLPPADSVIEESLGGGAQLASAYIPQSNSKSEKNSLASVAALQLPQLNMNARVKSADATAQANIKPRSAWGANQSWMDWTPEYAKFEAVVIHHTAGSNSYTQAQVPSVLQGIYNYHARTLGWGDIGYNVLIDKYGGRWEGRYGTLSSPAAKMVIGGHARPRNTNTLGVSVMGDYTQVQPTSTVINALADVTAWRFILAKVDPTTTSPLTIPSETSTYKNKVGQFMPRIVGHKDVGATACPGSIYNQLSTIRSKVSQLYRASITPPSYTDVDKLAKDNKSVLADGVYKISMASASGSVLDVDHGSTGNGVNIGIWSDTGNTWQKFRVSHDSQGYVTITSLVSGRVLESSGLVAVDGTNVQQWASNGGRNQKWVAVKVAGGIQLVSALSADGASAYALDANGGYSTPGTNVQVWTKNTSNAQKWNFTKTDLITPGVYRINSQVTTNDKVSLDIPSGAVNSGENVHVWAANESIAQRFYISAPDSNGAVQIQSIASGLYVTADSDGNVSQRSGGLLASQKWKVKWQTDGTFMFVNVANDKVLDVANGSSASGTNVLVWQNKGANWQKWRISARAATLPDGTYTIFSVMDPGQVIDIDHGSKDAGANALIWQASGAQWQKWKAVSNPDGTYSFVSLSSDQLLDVANNRMENGTNVLQWTNKDVANQRFYVTWDPKLGGFKIAAKANKNYVFDLTGGTAENGTNLELWQSNNQKWQRFGFQLTS